MMVEISVNSKFAARLNLVQPSPDVIGIGDHAFDTGQNFQEFEHRPAIHKVEDVPYAHGKSLHYIERQLLFLGIIEFAPLDLPWLRKIVQGCLGGLCRQEVVKINMRERLAGSISLGVRLS